MADNIETGGVHTNHTLVLASSNPVERLVEAGPKGRMGEMLAMIELALRLRNYQAAINALISPGWPKRHFGLGDERSSATDLLLAHHAYTEMAAFSTTLISYPIEAVHEYTVAALEGQRLPFHFHLAAALEMLDEDERAIGVLIKAAVIARQLGITEAAARAMVQVARILEQYSK